jgi:hypothetical protein
MQYIGILKHHHERYCMCACGAVRSHPVVLYWHQENPPNVQNNKWEWAELGQYYQKWLLESFGNPKTNLFLPYKLGKEETWRYFWSHNISGIEEILPSYLTPLMLKMH